MRTRPFHSRILISWSCVVYSFPLKNRARAPRETGGKCVSLFRYFAGYFITVNEKWSRFSDRFGARVDADHPSGITTLTKENPPLPGFFKRPRSKSQIDNKKCPINPENVILSPASRVFSLTGGEGAHVESGSNQEALIPFDRVPRPTTLRIPFNVSLPSIHFPSFLFGKEKFLSLVARYLSRAFVGGEFFKVIAAGGR